MADLNDILDRVAAIKNIKYDPNRHTILENSGLRELLINEDGAQRMRAIEMLSAIAINPNGRILIAEYGILQMIVHLFARTTGNEKSAFCRLIFLLAKSTVNSTIFVNFGVAQHMINYLRKLRGEMQEDYRIIAERAIAQLCNTDTGRISFLERDVINAIILKNNGQDIITLGGIDILRAISYSYNNKLKLEVSKEAILNILFDKKVNRIYMHQGEFNPAVVDFLTNISLCPDNERVHQLIENMFNEGDTSIDVYYFFTIAAERRYKRDLVATELAPYIHRLTVPQEENEETVVFDDVVERDLAILKHLSFPMNARIRYCRDESFIERLIDFICSNTSTDTKRIISLYILNYLCIADSTLIRKNARFRGALYRLIHMHEIDANAGAPAKEIYLLVASLLYLVDNKKYLHQYELLKSILN